MYLTTIKPTIYLPKWQFQYGYPHSNTFLQVFTFQTTPFSTTKSLLASKTICQPIKCNDVRFPTVNHRINCCKYLTSSNQTSPYIGKCIRTNILTPHSQIWIPTFWWRYSYEIRMFLILHSPIYPAISKVLVYPQQLINLYQLIPPVYLVMIIKCQVPACKPQ